MEQIMVVQPCKADKEEMDNTLPGQKSHCLDLNKQILKHFDWKITAIERKLRRLLNLLKLG